jgi:hypothetical protein
MAPGEPPGCADRWLLLVDAALANRALDPVLPRLFQRDQNGCSIA